MKALAATLAEAGYEGVRTYIQSGNVVFEAPPSQARAAASGLAAIIEERFGLSVPVVTRTAGELAAVVRSNPLLRAGVDTERMHVGFLTDRPAPSAIARLDPQRSIPDVFAVQGREIYLICPNGMARTKLTNDYFDSKLGVTSTFRNWRTVLTMLELAGAKA